MKPGRKKSSLLIRLICLVCACAMLLTSCGGNGPADGHTVCVDADNNHKCDVCSSDVSGCADADADHKCDVCQASLSECKDGDRDHKCDTCGKTISVCIEGKGHSCTTCGAVMSVCVDTNNDHKCDGCGVFLSRCTDIAPADHECDICYKMLSGCEDGNSDHGCDVCGGTLSGCEDSNSDHKCDICGETLTPCRDSNSDHVCDLCKKTISVCQDKGGDHYCDVCAAKLTECDDTDSDHKCNSCGQTISVCMDVDNDHKCETCSVKLSGCEDGNNDHKCDVCSKTLTECTYDNRVCTVCGDTDTYKHVVIVGVDGAGTFFRNTPTPNMDAIFADGAITYEGITESPSISAQSWASLMHGVNCNVHGITADSVGTYPIDSDYPSFFRAVRECDPDAELGSYTTWNTINELMVEDVGVTKVGWSGTDADLTDKICTYVESASPNVLFIQFDNVDAAGHHYGFGSDEHLAKITETDVLIGRIYDSYVKAGIIDDTLFIVTTDHGGTRVASGDYLGNHGGETPEEKQITFAAKGKTVVKGGEIEGLEIRDTAAIVLYALGYEQPVSWTARVPSGLFEGVTAGERPVWTKPTKQLSDYVEKDALLHLNFDGGYADATGSYTTSTKGNISYSDGYLGNAISLNNSSVTLEDFEIGTNDLTFATWINVKDMVGSDPVVFANKSWRNGANAGILVSVHQLGYIQINVADGTNRTDLKVNYVTSVRGEWIHLIVVLDRENNQVRLSINFDELKSADMHESLKDVSFDTEYDIVVGQDGTGAYTSYLKSAIDDFIIFDGAFDMKDVQALATYYGEKAAEESYRGHTSEPTPKKGSSGYVSNYVSDKELIAYLPFDGDIADATGSYRTSSNGSISYGSGYYGQAVNVNKSAVNLEDFSSGSKSITFATWLKVTHLEGGDPVIFANKSWQSGKNAGILVCIHSDGKLRVNIADGSNRTDYLVDYPTDMLDGWMHLTVVYDMEKNEIRVSFDFGDFLVGKLTPENYGDSLDGAYDLAIGEDGTNVYTAYIKGYIDEFMIFDGAFDADDLASLEEYYNQY